MSTPKSPVADIRRYRRHTTYLQCAVAAAFFLTAASALFLPV